MNNTLLPYQREGVDWLKAHPQAILADQMGLGKTIQAVVYAKELNSYNNIVICPASLKLNWKKEWEKWGRNKVGICNGDNWPDTPTVLINYDILYRHRHNINSRDWDLIICDESPKLKNPRSRWTRMVCGGRGTLPIKAERKLMLTGTPIVNRPMDLFETLHYLDPYEWPNRHDFGTRYCEAEWNPWSHNWDYSGANNLDDLQRRLRSTLMLRRLKSEVLRDLPPKVRQIIALEPDKQITRKEKKSEIVNKLKRMLNLNEKGWENAVKKLIAVGPEFESVSLLRHETALAKVPAVIEHLQEAVESSGKVVCFAHHKDVIAQIAAAFRGACVTLTGSTAMLARQKAVEDFQNRKEISLFLGNIQAAGVGLTLTASSHVVFAELDWVPGNVTQAEDRCHRIGQTDSVLVQHLVLDESLDAYMAKRIVEKQNVIDRALDLDPELVELFS